MNITMMKNLNDMSITQLNNTKAMIDTLIKQKVKNEMRVGTKVFVVQKTKKTPYRVPMTMLEVA
jgi:hypothetical protein